jgi:hypothetical protein
MLERTRKMKPRIVTIQVEVETAASIPQLEKYLALSVRGAKLKLVEKPKCNVIRGTKP